MADPFSILNWKRHWWAFQLVATSINVFTIEPSLSGRGPNPIAHKTHVHHSRTSPSSRCGVPYFLKTRNMLHCKVGPCVATCPILLICCFNQPLTLFSFSCYCVAIARKITCNVIKDNSNNIVYCEFHCTTNNMSASIFLCHFQINNAISQQHITSVKVSWSIPAGWHFIRHCRVIPEAERIFHPCAMGTCGQFWFNSGFL